MSLLSYSTGDTHLCDHCELEFHWDSDMINETYDEDHEGRMIIMWTVVCPHCEETNRVL